MLPALAHKVRGGMPACRLLMFHGPIRDAVPFFETMGFRCPERKDHASFLQEVTTPKGKPLMSALPFLCCSALMGLKEGAASQSASACLCIC